MSATKFVCLFFVCLFVFWYLRKNASQEIQKVFISYFCLNAFTPHLNISKLYLLFMNRIGHKAFWILKVKHFCN